MKLASRVQICVRTVGLGNDTAANQPLQGRESTRLGSSHFVILSYRNTGPKHTATAPGRATRHPNKILLERFLLKLLNAISCLFIYPHSFSSTLVLLPSPASVFSSSFFSLLSLSPFTLFSHFFFSPPPDLPSLSSPPLFSR